MPSRREHSKKSIKSGRSEYEEGESDEQPQQSPKTCQNSQNQQQSDGKKTDFGQSGNGPEKQSTPQKSRGSPQQKKEGQGKDDKGKFQQQQQDQQQQQEQQQQQQRCQCSRQPCQQRQSDAETILCAKCEQEITTGQVMTLLGRKWHPECFVCESCCSPLAKSSFFLDGDKTFCSTCWTQNVKVTCARCNGEINGENLVVNFGVKRFHKSCFVCSRCRCDLNGLQFCIKNNEFTCQQCM